MKKILSLIFLMVFGLSLASGITPNEKKNNASRTNKTPKGQSGLISNVFSQDVDSANGKTSPQQQAKIDFSQLYRTGDLSSRKVAYYSAVRRCYGWWTGLGKELSLNSLNQTPYYYKFSNKNRLGWWQTVEFIGDDSIAKLENSRLSYADLMRLENVNYTSFAAIGDVVRWEFIPDLSGANLLQERGYNAKGELVYALNIEEYSDGNFFMFYNDGLGLPIFENSSITMQCDKNGYESIVNFSDCEGYYVPNRLGVYEIHLSYGDGRLKIEDYTVAGHKLTNHFKDNSR